LQLHKKGEINMDLEQIFEEYEQLYEELGFNEIDLFIEQELKKHAFY